MEQAEEKKLYETPSVECVDLTLIYTDDDPSLNVGDDDSSNVDGKIEIIDRPK